MFTNFDYMDLMDASRVCTLFKRIAKEAFPKVYNGDTMERYFEVTVDATDEDIGEQQLYGPFFKTFGKTMVALGINIRNGSNEQDHWLFTAIRDSCKSLTHVTLTARADDDDERILHFDPMTIFRLVPKLTNLTLTDLYIGARQQWTTYNHPHLQSLCVRITRENTGGTNAVHGFTIEMFNRFVQNNPQLKHLHLFGWGTSNEIIQSLKGQLNGFKSLKIIKTKNHNTHEGEYKTDNNDDGLESLTISLCRTTAVDALEAITNECKLVKHLSISLEPSDDDMDEEIVEVICSFDQVELLTLKGLGFRFPLMQTLMRRLPKLEKLRFMICCYYGEQFNINLYHRFVDIIKGRNIPYKFQLFVAGTEMLFTNEKCIMYGKLRPRVGYEVERSHSQTTFEHLDEACIGKIAEYLCEYDVRALYETCTLAKKALAKHIAAQKFRVVIHNDLLKAKDIISRFGEHMGKLSVDFRDNAVDKAQIMDIWNLIGAKCNKTLVELEMDGGQARLFSSSNVSFPNLEVLKLVEMGSDGPYVFPLMNCPELRHLELTQYEITGDIEAFQLGIPLDGLEVLRIDDCDLNMYKVLNGLSDTICERVKELSLYDFVSSTIMMNFVIRFRNITTLHLLDDTIEQTDTKYLFRCCQKLVKLSLRYGNSEGKMPPIWHRNHYEQMLKNANQYCKQLKTLHLYRRLVDVFVEHDLEYIADLLPKVEIKLVSYNDDNDGYEMATYEKPVLLD